MERKSEFSLHWFVCAVHACVGSGWVYACCVGVGMSVCIAMFCFTPPCSAVFLFVVNPNESNVFDHKRVEFKLWEE